jgi:hypothetical protein
MSLTRPWCLVLSKNWKCFTYINNLYQECWQRNSAQTQVDHGWADQSSRKQLWSCPKVCQRLWNLKFSYDPKSKWQCPSHEVSAELLKSKVMLEELFIWQGILHRKFFSWWCYDKQRDEHRGVHPLMEGNFPEVSGSVGCQNWVLLHDSDLEHLLLVWKQLSWNTGYTN